MDKVISYLWSKDKRRAKFIIDSTTYDELEKSGVISIINDWRKCYDDFSIDNAYYLERNFGDKRSYAQVVVENIEKLQNNGFVLTAYAQRQYNYWRKKFDEEKENQQLEVCKPKIEEVKPLQQKVEYQLFCNEMGCVIKNIIVCNNCKRNILYGCKPALLRIV